MWTCREQGFFVITAIEVQVPLEAVREEEAEKAVLRSIDTFLNRLSLPLALSQKARGITKFPSQPLIDDRDHGSVSNRRRA